MIARAIIVAVALVCLVGGAALYWLQVYAYYGELPAQATAVLNGPAGPDAADVVVAVENFRGIDSASSPIRYRACFDLALPPAAMDGFTPYADARPLNAPGWFDCFDAAAIGAALESGEARAVLGERDVHYGIDRVVALFPDGRAFAWHQINPCGAVVFDGQPAPEGCPPPPESLS